MNWPLLYTDQHYTSRKICITNLTDEALRNTPDTSFERDDQTNTWRLVIEGREKTADILLKIAAKYNWFGKIVTGKKHEYVQMLFLREYLRTYCSEKEIHLKMASWSDDIEHGIDVTCQIWNQKFLVDLTANWNNIDHKRNKARARQQDNKWIVYISIDICKQFRKKLLTKVNGSNKKYSNFATECFRELINEGLAHWCRIQPISWPWPHLDKIKI